jgi:hypothetical protein
MLIDGANVVGSNSHGRLRKLGQFSLGGGSAGVVEQWAALIRIQQQLDAFDLLLGGATQLVAPFEGLAAVLVTDNGGGLGNAATLCAGPVGDGVYFVWLVGKGVCDAVGGQMSVPEALSALTVKHGDSPAIRSSEIEADNQALRAIVLEINVLQGVCQRVGHFAGASLVRGKRNGVLGSKARSVGEGKTA